MSTRTVHEASLAWRVVVRCLFLAAAALVIGVAAARSADRLPVLLLYGFQPVPGFYAPNLWSEFAERLSGRESGDVERIRLEESHDFYYYARVGEGDRDVFVGDYGMPLEPTIRDVRFYADRVDKEIQSIRARLDTDKVAVIGHSMGGLVARCYIEAGDFASALGTAGFPDYGTVYRNDIKILITLATPHHGTEIVALGPRWAYGSLSRQIEPGSEMLHLLNSVDGSGDALNDEIRYVSMGGQTCFGCGVRRDGSVCLAACISQGRAWIGSDLVILMQSTRLDGAENVACIGFDHVDMHMHEALLDAIQSILDGAPAPREIFSAPELQEIADLPPNGA